MSGCTETFGPSINCIIDDALLQLERVADIDQSLLQFIDVMNFRL